VLDLTIEVRAEAMDEQFAERLEKTLASASGGSCPVSLVYRQPCNTARIKLGERWQVLPTDELLQELREVVGAEKVALEYR
jgi:DNA polymerase III subunit alpha